MQLMITKIAKFYIENIIFYTMTKKKSCGDSEKYEVPQVDLFQISGQSILDYLSTTLPDGVEEGDEDTFLPI